MNFVDLVRSSLREIHMDEVVVLQPQHCTSFRDLTEIYKSGMTVTQSMLDCMAICMATHIAVALEGDPLWIYLVGSPSSGKSTLCELLSSDELHSRPISKFTGLVSGSRQGSHLIPMLQGRCVIVKDGTLLLESNPQQLANVYGELRDIFDGSLEAHYRNGVSASFTNISFGMVIGITERIYSLNMAALGERFLHCRLETDRIIETQRNAAAITSIFESSARTSLEGNEDGDSRGFPRQRAHTAGFLSHLHNKIRTEDVLRPKYTDYDLELIQSLGDTIACSRAQAPRSKDFAAELLYDARPEASTRVVKQLGRLTLCLCYVMGTDTITDAIRSLVTKVALDTSFSRQHNIIRTVALSENGLNRQSIAMMTSIPLETISRRIDDLVSLAILIPNDTDNRPGRGRSVPTLKCARWIQDAFRLVEKHINVSDVPDSEDSQPQSSSTIVRQGRPPQKKRANLR
jgi:hypothetical protein